MEVAGSKYGSDELPIFLHFSLFSEDVLTPFFSIKDIDKCGQIYIAFPLYLQ